MSLDAKTYIRGRRTGDEKFFADMVPSLSDMWAALWPDALLSRVSGLYTAAEGKLNHKEP